MRWFWISIIIVTLAAIDKAFMDGENGRFAISTARSAAAVMVHKSEDLVAYLKR
jgi:hypothetical protein